MSAPADAPRTCWVCLPGPCPTWNDCWGETPREPEAQRDLFAADAPVSRREGDA